MLTACLALGTAEAAEKEPADPNTVAAQVELIVRLTAEGQASKAEAVLWAELYGYPIRVTLCWTDPPATVIIEYDNPSPRLIHDLDLRVAGPGGSTTCYPYIVKPTDPCAIATMCD